MTSPTGQVTSPRDSTQSEEKTPRRASSQGARRVTIEAAPGREGSPRLETSPREGEFLRRKSLHGYAHARTLTGVEEIKKTILSPKEDQ